MLAKIYLSHSGTTSNKWTCPEWVKRLPGTTEPHESKWQMFWLQVTMLPGLIMTRVLYKQWTAVQWKARKTMQGNNAWWECINAMPTSFLVINDAVLFWRATCHYIWNQNKHITYACDLFGEMGGYTIWVVNIIGSGIDKKAIIWSFLWQIFWSDYWKWKYAP